ncbi:MAG: hypothetical protein ACE5NN_00315 [Candidatus Bathyarchaeia archaeon]
MNKSTAGLAAALIVTAFLGWNYSSLLFEFNKVSSEHNSLKVEYERLLVDYDNVSSRYQALLTDYDNLAEELEDLARKYEIMYDTRYQEGYNDGHLQGNLTGYKTGYDAGYVQGVTDGAGRGYDIRDPTYREALEFVSFDLTDKNEYDKESYTCVNFAADFKNNALNAGYKCGYVYIQFPDSAHTIVCFNTTDRGLIFVEPQIDEIMTLTIGQPYWDRTRYEAPDFDDTVVRFVIAW